MINKKDKPHEKASDNNNKSGANTNDTSASNRIKDPDEWATGDEEITGAQRSYLKTLSAEVGEEANENLTKAEASKKIDELQHKTRRGLKDDKS